MGTRPESMQDTIAALGTPPGRGGIGIVRISGPLARSIGIALTGVPAVPRQADYRNFLDSEGEIIDAGLVLFFAAPHSFTGEDVLELQGHGSPVIMDMLLQRVLTLGARLAQPGEFSRRAFLNGKMDLIQAEAIADLIDSASEEAARSAQRSLQGDFSHRIQTLREKLVDLRAYLEAAIDFPEEEIDHLSDGFVDARLAEILESSIGIVASAKQGSILREGITVVIAGAPNVGKSSLLNCLAESDRAIVTHIPGTTRDLLREHLQIDGLPMNVVDTAGLRVTLDTIEQEGIQRAWGAIGSADVILLVIDDRIGFGPEEEAILTALPPKLPLLVVRNKIDLSNAAAGVSETSCWVEIYLSAKTSEGIGFLKEQMKKIVGFQSAGEGTFMARRRHLEALGKVQEYLQSARRQLACRAAELVAEDLRQAQNALGEITGEFTTEDLLDRIFASFCIGK